MRCLENMDATEGAHLFYGSLHPAASGSRLDVVADRRYGVGLQPGSDDRLEAARALGTELGLYRNRPAIGQHCKVGAVEMMLPREPHAGDLAALDPLGEDQLRSARTAAGSNSSARIWAVVAQRRR
jgi:hypothetical protein